MDRLSELRRSLDHLSRELAGLVATPATKSFDRYVPDLKAAENRVRAELGESPDVMIRHIKTAAGAVAMVVYTDNMVDTARIDREILNPLAKRAETEKDADALPVGHLIRVKQWSQAFSHILSGYTAVFVPDAQDIWLVDTTKVPQRAIDRPQTEKSVRGPQDAFTEVLATQVSQIRQRLVTEALVFEQIQVGTQYPVSLAVAYLRNLVNPKLLDAVRQRLSTINAASIVNSTQVANYLKDHRWSIFPTVRSSERVDYVTWQLLNGKVAVLVEGDPFVLLVPATLLDYYRTSQDYTDPWYTASFVRFLRCFGWTVGVYLPAAYIAITEVNLDLIPPSLLVLTAATHTGLPFSPFVEVLMMILVIEILREAALRLPQALSTTIGTVGAIVVGTAVVKAGFVSAQIIVVMTFTALAIFTSPTYDMTGTLRLLSWVMLLSALVFGIYGMVLATLWTSAALIRESSFGEPYLVPLAPFREVDWINALVRVPWTAMKRRTTVTRSQDPAWMPEKPAPAEPVDLRNGQSPPDS